MTLYNRTCPRCGMTIGASKDALVWCACGKYLPKNMVKAQTKTKTKKVLVTA